MPPYAEIDIIKQSAFEVWVCCRIHTYSDPLPIAEELQRNLSEYLATKSYSFGVRTKVEGDKIYIKKIRKP